MTAPALEILQPLRSAIVAVSAITSKLGAYNGSPSVHTRRPVPAAAEYPMVTIGPIITRTDEDGLNSYRPVVTIDVITYGEQGEHFRDVESVAESVYALFHRQQAAIAVQHYSVSQITCQGPYPAPADGDTRVARRVTLSIRLYAKA